MPQRCSICSHPEQATIDQALDDTVPLRQVATRFGVGKTSLLRHQTHRSPEADHEADHAPAVPTPAPACPCMYTDWQDRRTQLAHLGDQLWDERDPELVRLTVLVLARVVHELLTVMSGQAAEETDTDAV